MVLARPWGFYTIAQIPDGEWLYLLLYILHVQLGLLLLPRLFDSYYPFDRDCQIRLKFLHLPTVNAMWNGGKEHFQPTNIRHQLSHVTIEVKRRFGFQGLLQATSLLEMSAVHQLRQLRTNINVCTHVTSFIWTITSSSS